MVVAVNGTWCAAKADSISWRLKGSCGGSSCRGDGCRRVGPAVKPDPRIQCERGDAPAAPGVAVATLCRTWAGDSKRRDGENGDGGGTGGASGGVFEAGAVDGAAGCGPGALGGVGGLGLVDEDLKEVCIV